MNLRSLLTSAAGIILVVGAAAPGDARAQGGRGAAPQAPVVPQTGAPIDITGYWVSIVTEDWRIRMITPEKGDVPSVPLNTEGRRVANLWDPAKDEADGNQCKAYGAPAIMRVPGRIHIQWADDHTLKIDTDAGTQTRLFHFANNSDPLDYQIAHQANEPPASWQGYSIAQWAGLGGRGQGKEGYLAVATNDLREGYLRKNGVPYSANALLREYYDTFTEPNGDRWLVITTIVTDPQFLTTPFVTSTHFKRLASDSGWSPTPCEVK